MIPQDRQYLAVIVFAFAVLFGFERTRTLCTPRGKAIAKPDQAFGQDDGITVLALERMVPA